MHHAKHTAIGAVFYIIPTHKIQIITALTGLFSYYNHNYSVNYNDSPGITKHYADNKSQIDRRDTMNYFEELLVSYAEKLEITDLLSLNEII